MIQEDYVSFEIAKLLKKKGFDEGCSFVVNAISKGVMPVSWPTTNSDLEDGGSNLIALPTLQMVMKWLRETYNIHIVLSPNKKMNNQYGSIIFVDKGGELHPQPTDFFHGTYEQACEAAITYCLTKLL